MGERVPMVLFFDGLWTLIWAELSHSDGDIELNEGSRKSTAAGFVPT